jgi:DNA polymerase III alpha subunit
MLKIHSKYSLRFGVHTPEDIAAFFAQAGYLFGVLTDINNTSGVLSFVRAAQKQTIQPVVGVDFRNGIAPCYVIIAKNNIGFQALNEFLSYHLHQQLQFPRICPDIPDCFVIYPLEHAPEKLKSNEYIGITRKQLQRLKFYKKHPLQKFVISDPMTFLANSPKELQRLFNTHRLLRAVDKNCLLSQLTPSDYTDKDAVFLTKQILINYYSDFPVILHNTIRLLNSCSLSFSFGDDAEVQNIATYTGSKQKDFQLLQKLALSGVNKRYSNPTQAIYDRIEKELSIIAQKNYLSYFLVTWDIIQYARQNNFFHVGRGSGANSIVAYLLGITNVDPIELDLYFERFINLYRKNPPDFDIDFSWKDRDQVVDYTMNRFQNTALLCTYNTFQFRAAVREIGKVLGLPAHEISKISEGKKVSAGIDKLGQLVVRYSQLIDGLPSYLSVHAGGIIISEKPTTYFGATFLPPKGFSTTQFSMLEAEDVGLYKYDILSQRGLSKIHDCIEIIRENKPEAVLKDIHAVAPFKQDPKLLQLLSRGDAMGCFYIESPAMRMLMKKLEVKTYLELVAASSIIRPGVSSSGMMREYILRHKHPERRKSAHPVLLQIMPETYGVMVYQEDVIKVAHHFAGLSLDEADVLRRGMSGKFRSREEFQSIREKFYTNCCKKGYSSELINEVWKQIESFAGYAFSKGHSASYAVESFQSLYLKAYFPLEYMVAVLNNGGGYYRQEVYVQEARKHGATIEAPDINRSNWLTIIRGTTIYLGFCMIEGVVQKEVHELLLIRKQRNKFTSFDEVVLYGGLSEEQLIILIRINAFRCFNPKRKELLWQLVLSRPSKNTAPSLFHPDGKEYTLPDLEDDYLELAFEQMELLNFPLYSPFELMDEYLSEHILAHEFLLNTGRIITTYGYLISAKRTTTSTGEDMFFGHFYDCLWTLFDSVHFPIIARQFPFRGPGIYQLSGSISEEFGFYTLEVKTMRKVNYISDTRYRENKKAAS